MRTVAERVAHPRHAGALEGASHVGELSSEDHRVRVGLWLDGAGVVRRARYRATTCAALIAYAEVACELLESGLPPSSLSAARLRSALSGVHPVHRDRASFVAGAIRAAAPGESP